MLNQKDKVKYAWLALSAAALGGAAYMYYQRSKAT